MTESQQERKQRLKAERIAREQQEQAERKAAKQRKREAVYKARENQRAHESLPAQLIFKVVLHPIILIPVGLFIFLMVGL